MSKYRHPKSEEEIDAEVTEHVRNQRMSCYIAEFENHIRNAKINDMDSVQCKCSPDMAEELLGAFLDVGYQCVLGEHCDGLATVDFMFRS